ncbi:MAG: hypothetical protein ABI639_07785 [Thermoanaerobaculia bacterium]
MPRPHSSLRPIWFAFVLAVAGLASAAPSFAAPCVPNATTLCFDVAPGDGRVSVKLDWSTTLGGGSSGHAHPVALQPVGITKGGMFWIFSADNPELIVKVINGCASNGHIWIYYSALTNAGFTLTATDNSFPTHTWTRTNPDLTIAASVAVIDAFTCDGSEPPTNPDIVEFGLPGEFLVSNASNEGFRFDMPFAEEREFQKVEIQFDVFIAGYDASKPNGYHTLLWFQNGPSWNDDMMVYMNIRPQSNTIRIESNVGNDTDFSKSPAPDPGEWYHVLWESNLSGIHQFYYRITRLADGHIVQASLLDNSYRHFIAATDGFLSVGGQPGAGQEADTIGWRFRDLEVKYFVSGL